MELVVNGQPHNIDTEDEMPLLWVLRDVLNLTGTKYGCGIAQCGACTVMIDGEAVKSCSVAVADVWGPVETIEAQDQTGVLSIVQQAWVDHQVAQCGYCQSGQIMAATAFLAQTPNPSDDDIAQAMADNLCRCGTYPKIRAAIRQAAQALAAKG